MLDNLMSFVSIEYISPFATESFIKRRLDSGMAAKVSKEQLKLKETVTAPGSRISLLKNSL